MPCIDCLQNCGGRSTSDQCTEYTGPDIPLLGICTGDQLSSVEADIINALLTALDGSGITPASVTVANCAWLQNQLIGENPTLANLLQLLINGECSLYAMIQTINNTIAGGNASFTTTCLSGLPDNATANQVLQALLTDYCIVKATVTAIPDTYVALTDLTLQVTQILTSLGLLGGSTSVQYAQYIPIGVAYPYFGSLANFNNVGVGLASVGFLGLFLCNGANGTPDIRGRGIVGAVRNVPGGALDSAVDPTQTFNPNTNYALLDKFGENYHTLITAELPSHSHGVTDTGHIHTSLIPEDQKAGGVSGYNVLSSAPPTRTGTYSQPTNSATTGISIQSTGGASFHYNVQPSIAAYWVIRLQ